ncbi:MAG TPA: DUF4129 domain-containing protein [Thermoanaerobaculia bacterium]
MSRGTVTVSGVLDEAVELVCRGVPGWAGLMALTALPLRFLEAHLANRLMQLGDDAPGYLNHLTAISWLATLALPLALWGRAVFVRACTLALAGGPGGARMPWRQILRLNPAGLVSYLYAALVYELLFFAVGWTLVALPALALLTGLAAATSPLRERPGLLASPMLALQHARPLAPLLGLTFLLGLGVVVAFVNVSALFWLLLWLADGTVGLDLSWWSATLSWDNRHFTLLALAGAVTLVEPFWLASLVSAVRRARAQQTGEDLAAWFAKLREPSPPGPLSRHRERGNLSGSGGGAPLPVTGEMSRPEAGEVRAHRTTLLLLIVTFLPVPLIAETLSVETYRQRVAGVDGRLRAGDWVGARTDAQQLLKDRIAFGAERLETDASVLRPLAEAPNAAAAQAAAPRLRKLAAALSSSPAQAPPTPSAKILEEVRKSQAVAELEKGGALPKGDDLGILDAITEVLEPFYLWLKDLWERFWNWLDSLLPERVRRTASGADLFTVVTVLVVVLAAAGAWLAFRAFRKRRRGEMPQAVPAEAPPPAADEDPLSRASGEWERYAHELAAAGRTREAIRAWYHAVLVSLFRMGALHYRKGRTNWEYVSALSPGYGWRATFIEVTRGFEREWYGRDRSTPEALREAEDLARGILDSLREAA